MANMCVGKLKIRGTKEEIINFFRNAISAINIAGDIVEYELKVDKLQYAGETCITIKPKGEDIYYFRLKGTNKGFIFLDHYKHEGNFIFVLPATQDNHIIVVEYEQAWDINADELAKVSKECGVDLRIYGFEAGMSFNRDIIINNGCIIRDEVIKFDDYEWECINPHLGG